MIAIRREVIPMLIVSTLGILGFTVSFLARENYEFLLYIGVIVFFFFVLLLTDIAVKFSKTALWATVLWAFLHMAGGGLPVGDGRLYDVILLPVSPGYEILKYDQFVHFIGFAAATLLMFELLQPVFKPGHRSWVRVSIVIVMAGLGVGALNEIVEFFATVITPETGVGGYINTSLDLVFDLFGALAMMSYIYWRDRKKENEPVQP